MRDLLVTPQESRGVAYEVKAVGGSSGQMRVTNIRTVPVAEASEVQGFLRQASTNRAVAATNINQHSSRSHLVFWLLLSGANASTGETVCGSLSLVDLAGWERLKESGVTGDRRTETVTINSSLSKLAGVIQALATKQSHIPYRDSKLTNLLQPCLGGNAKTLMLVNVVPLDHCVAETLNSLRFAASVNTCHVGAATKNASDRPPSSYCVFPVLSLRHFIP